MSERHIFSSHCQSIVSVLFVFLATSFLVFNTPWNAKAEESNDPQREAYEETIHKIIVKNFETPHVAKTKKLTCQVDIEIDKDGKVQKYTVMQKSGSKTFDEAVTRAIDKVKELPPPPTPAMLDIELTFQSKGKSTAP